MLRWTQWLIWCILSLKIEYSTEYGVWSWKTSGFLLAWGDCHIVWSNWNCGYWLIAADRTCWDEHNGMAWRGDKTSGFILALEDCRNVWSDRNCGYQLMISDLHVMMNTMVDRMFFSPWKLNTAQNSVWGGDIKSDFLLAWWNCHNLWSDQNLGYWLIVADRTCQDEHNGWLYLCRILKIEYST